MISPHICSDFFSKQMEFYEWKIPGGKNTTWALFIEMPFLILRLDVYWGAFPPLLVALGEKLRAGDGPNPSDVQIPAIRIQL